MAQQEYKRGCQYAEVYRPSMFIRFQSIKTLVTILVSFVCISVVVLVPLFRPDEKFLTSKLDQQYFDDFVGASECKIHVHDLYSVALRDQAGFYDANTFCGKRSQLLTALSDGGRIGFDTPYIPKGCHYRWFNVKEICFIMSRFDGLLFMGDESLQTVYNGLNILLRQDLVHGALKTVDSTLSKECRCNNQFIKQACSKHFVTDSHDLKEGKSCSIRHAMINNGDMIQFKELVPKAPRSQYRPIPIVHSLSPSTFSKAEAEDGLKKVVQAADESERNTPMLWIGPTASGHVEIRGRKGNQEIWEFDRHMSQVAGKVDVDVLGVWNLTVQASSWDGVRFGERVAIVQAMMVLNWLSRVESS